MNLNHWINVYKQVSNTLYKGQKWFWNTIDKMRKYLQTVS